MKKFIRWGFTPILANKIENDTLRRAYWVVAYTASIYALIDLYREMKEIREEEKSF